MSRWSAADLVAYTSRGNAMIATDKPRTRHGNHKIEWQGQKFDSKHELKDFQGFELERLAGKIRSVIRQVSIPLLGSRRRIRLDFVIVENDGRIRWVDSKGHAEREWLLKRDVVQQAYGIRIETC
ncbi:MAG TPA: DUF1064 domain-containing protein [Nitrospiraceae bacterium]|nr:DUF1064 domain-containing protein [Nitrospiraceae bacterium]